MRAAVAVAALATMNVVSVAVLEGSSGSNNSIEEAFAALPAAVTTAAVAAGVAVAVKPLQWQ